MTLIRLRTGAFPKGDGKQEEGPVCPHARGQERFARSFKTKAVFYRPRRLLLALGCLILSAPSPAHAYDDLIRIDTYDALFIEYSKRYFGADFDWRIFKAQAIAESRLNPVAVSHKNATGIMQLLPRTYRQITRENPDVGGGIREPHSNIAAGIYYDRKLWDLWQVKRTVRERLRFMFGAYNAGKKTILDAQQVAIKKKLNPYSWPSIEQSLESLDPDYRQTLVYVKKVFWIRSQMDREKRATHCITCKASRNQ